MCIISEPPTQSSRHIEHTYHMKSIKNVLKNFNPTQDKYISREYQSFGVHIAQKLDDEAHKSLYIRMARDVPRPVLERALQFVSDANARNKAALFMWKLKDMNAWGKKKKKKTK